MKSIQALMSRGRGELGRTHAVILWEKFWLYCGLIFAAGGLLGFGVARADDQSYLDQLAAAGVPMNPMNSQAAMLQRGDAACRLLKAHVPPDQVAGQLGFNGWMWNSRIVDVAQRELCPTAGH